MLFSCHISIDIEIFSAELNLCSKKMEIQHKPFDKISLKSDFHDFSPAIVMGFIFGIIES